MNKKDKLLCELDVWSNFLHWLSKVKPRHTTKQNEALYKRDEREDKQKC